jgi:hypothetical protein
VYQTAERPNHHNPKEIEMAKRILPRTRPINGADEVPEERDSNRIRAFLAKVKPLSGCTVGELDEYWQARSLIEQLALAYDVENENYHWDANECGMAVQFLHWIEPVKGSCFCNDRSRINLTCGFHAILQFIADQLFGFAARQIADEVRRLAPKVKGRKRAAEVAHG